MTSDRRRFLTQAALGAAGLAVPSGATPQSAASGRGAAASRGTGAPTPTAALDPLLLAALGDAVLPESLGADGRRRAVAAFTAWLAAYAPVAEEMHGYGYAELTYTPEHPGPGWQAQLEALDALARRTRKRGFARLGIPARRAVLEARLARVSGATVPGTPLEAPHVAVALLAHWAATSDAQDLAYGARIGAGHCRSLADTARRPLPLAAETPR